jgi:hypothetical protein
VEVIYFQLKIMVLDVFPSGVFSQQTGVINTGVFNNPYEVLALSIAQNLTMREFIWLQGVVPYVASPNFYEKLLLNSATSTSRATSFAMETSGRVLEYTSYYNALSSNSKVPLPYKTIYSGEYSYGCSEIAITAEEIQRFSGDNGRLQHIIYNKMKAKMMSFYTNFQDYIEKVIKNSNQFYQALRATDTNGVDFFHPIPVGLNNGNTTLSVTAGMEKAFGTGFEVFNEHSGRVVDFIGYSTTGERPLHIMSNSLKRTLYSQSAKLPNVNLVSYTEAMSELVWNDELNGSTVACGNRATIKHIPGSAIPKYNLTTEALEGGATNFTINAIDFTYDDNLKNLVAGSITIGATGGNGLTLKTGDVFFIEGTRLMKNTFGNQVADAQMTIVVAPTKTYDANRAIYTYQDAVIIGAGGTFTFNFVGNFRPALQNDATNEGYYSPNFKFTDLAGGTNIRLASLKADVIAALTGKVLLPLVGEREAVVIYYPKKMYFSPREVIMPTDLYTNALQTTMKQSVPEFGQYLDNSVMPVTATFNKLGDITTSKGLDLVFQLWAESGCAIDDYQVNMGIIPVINYSSSRTYL